MIPIDALIVVTAILAFAFFVAMTVSNGFRAFVLRALGDFWAWLGNKLNVWKKKYHQPK